MKDENLNTNSYLGAVNKRFAVATETTDDIIRGRKCEIMESENMGHYIIDESGEEMYYNDCKYKTFIKLNFN